MMYLWHNGLHYIGTTSFAYNGVICYEKKDGDWIVRFYVVKDLDILLMVNNVLKSYVGVKNYNLLHCLCQGFYIVLFYNIYSI